MKIEARSRLDAATLSTSLYYEFLDELALSLGNIAVRIGSNIAVKRAASRDEVVAKLESLGWVVVKDTFNKVSLERSGGSWPISYLPGVRNIYVHGDFSEGSTGARSQQTLISRELRRLIDATPAGKVSISVDNKRAAALNYAPDLDTFKVNASGLGYKVVRSVDGLVGYKKLDKYRLEFTLYKGKQPRLLITLTRVIK